VLELDRDLALGAPGEAALHEPLVDLVNERCSVGDRRDLRFVLDDPEVLDDPARRHELAA